MADFHSVTTHISRLELSWNIAFIRFPVAIWLVRTESGFVLVDSGPPASADQVVAAVARATGGRGLKMVLLTHAHPDHAGGLAALRSAWNPAILCHRDEVPFVTGEWSYRQLPAGSPAYWLGRYFIPRPSEELPVSRDLEGGVSVEGMAVISLPGHTPGHIGFLHPGDAAMICGDTIRNLGGKLSAPPSISTYNPELARASMARLAELDFDHLLPSHGFPIKGSGRQAVRRFIEREFDFSFDEV
jgi:glyoxylase-like metal-dependent hydrolase (beta-lactamase superfamily II)